MSQSDSDLDFESADEDADFIPNSKKDCDLEIKINTSKTNPPESLISTKIEAKISDKIVAENNDSSISENTKIVRDVQEEKTEKIDRQKEENISSSTIDSTNMLNVQNDLIADVKAANKSYKYLKEGEADEVKNTDKTKDVEVQQKDNVDQEAISPAVNIPEASITNKSEEPEIQVEKPRVLLRIEKKKQQESQCSRRAPIEKPSDFINYLREEPKPQQYSSWGFSSWGSTLLSTAASSVSTFSSQVSQGIGSVFETVESTLGAPTPEELASTLHERKKEKEESSNQDENNAIPGLLPDVSSWTKVLEDTGSKVLFGGLDTLEMIGKKTMDILTDGDPGLRMKRAVFSDKVNIAELLKEARAKAEKQDDQERNDLQKRAVNYSHIFEEKQGIVHLEALEMLSNQSQVKLQRLLMRHSKDMEVKKRLSEIKHLCEDLPLVEEQSDCENFEDFRTVFKKLIIKLSLPVIDENILKLHNGINEDITRFEKDIEDFKTEAKDVFHASICSLAEFTARCVEVFHKISELIIVQPKLQPDVDHCVANLTGLTTVMCVEVNNFSAKYHKCIESIAKSQGDVTTDEMNITTMATNLYVEAANSNKYIQDAFLLLVPVLQLCFLETLD